MVEPRGGDDLNDELERLGLVLDARTLDGGSTEYVLSGNTFAHREAIKAAGGRWRRDEQAWVLSDADRLVTVAERAAATSTGGGLGLNDAATKFSGYGTKHYHGHRERLRNRFKEQGPESLADYELLEQLLFYSIRRRDTKPIAKELIERFGGLGAVFAAEPTRIAEAPSLAAVAEDAEDKDLPFTAILIKTVQALMERIAKEQIKDRAVIGSWTALIDYLTLALAHETKEQLRVLFLDRKNVLIKDEVLGKGTVDHTPLYPREVVSRALELSASAIILVHNHPSGDPNPSRPDIEMTKQVVAALSTVGISLHDHVIVGKNGHTSFKGLKLI